MTSQAKCAIHFSTGSGTLPGIMSVRGGLSAPPTHGKIKHVLLISLDGLHALDVANFVKSNPGSNLAQLSSRGVTYTQASTSKPSDSFPGLMSIVTGGSPISTGLWYEGAYARDLSPAGSHCKTIGTEIVWDSGIDRNKKQFDGGGIDPAKLPLNPEKGCSPVYPHDYLRVNTIFEIVHQANMRTALVDKHPSYEMVNGPSGKGVEDLFTPELAASGASRDVKAAEIFDDKKIEAVLNEINGKDHTGSKDAPTANLFGTAVSAAAAKSGRLHAGDCHFQTRRVAYRSREASTGCRYHPRRNYEDFASRSADIRVSRWRSRFGVAQRPGPDSKCRRYLEQA